MKNVPLLLGTILGTLLLIVGAAYMLSNGSQSGGAQTVDQQLLLSEARHFYGPQESAVTVVEFSDLECPACRAVHPLVIQLKSEYGDTVKYVYRHFPLDSIHPNARLAAQASEVVAEQGKFFEYTDLLFERQEQWSVMTDKEALISTLYDYAKEMQLDIDKATFSEKIVSQEVVGRVSADVAIGNAVQVRGTPTFFVNGQVTPAPQLFSAVESALNQQ